MSTEASMRYSKGVDEVNSEYAVMRACQLVEMLGAGEVIGGTIDICSSDLNDRVIRVKAQRVNELLGTDIPVETMVKCLERVFIKTVVEGDTLVCTIPHYRSDMAGSADVTEEVARIYGYDNIPSTETRGRMMRNVNNHNISLYSVIKQFAVDLGFYEMVTYSFTGEAMWDKLMLSKDHPLRRAVKIINPLGDDTAYMRTTLIADMLNVISTNVKRKNKNVRLNFQTSQISSSSADAARIWIFMSSRARCKTYLINCAYRRILNTSRAEMSFSIRDAAREYLLTALKLDKWAKYIRMCRRTLKYREGPTLRK